VVCHSDSDWQSRDRDIVSSGVFHANLLRSASHNSYNHPRAVPRVYWPECEVARLIHTGRGLSRRVL